MGGFCSSCFPRKTKDSLQRIIFDPSNGDIFVPLESPLDGIPRGEVEKTYTDHIYKECWAVFAPL